MMKIERMFLTLVSLLPLKNAAFAADSKLLTMAGADAESSHLWSNILARKAQLFEPYSVATTHHAALDRFSKLSGLENEAAKKEFDALVIDMIENNLITVNEDAIRTGIPSAY